MSGVSRRNFLFGGTRERSPGSSARQHRVDNTVWALAQGTQWASEGGKLKVTGDSATILEGQVPALVAAASRLVDGVRPAAEIAATLAEQHACTVDEAEEAVARLIDLGRQSGALARV